MQPHRGRKQNKTHFHLTGSDLMATQPITQLLRQSCSSQFLSSHAPQSTGQRKTFLKDAWNMTVQTIPLAPC